MSPRYSAASGLLCVLCTIPTFVKCDFADGDVIQFSPLSSMLDDDQDSMDMLFSGGEGGPRQRRGGRGKGPQTQLDNLLGPMLGGGHGRMMMLGGGPVVHTMTFGGPSDDGNEMNVMVKRMMLGGSPSGGAQIHMTMSGPPGGGDPMLKQLSGNLMRALFPQEMLGPLTEGSDESQSKAAAKDASKELMDSLKSKITAEGNAEAKAFKDAVKAKPKPDPTLMDIFKDLDQTFASEMLPLIQKATQNGDDPVACQEDVKRICSNAKSHLHCLGQNSEKISEGCRKQVGKSVPFRCSKFTEKFCDMLQVGIIDCLSKHLSELDDQCKDSVLITKHVIKNVNTQKTSVVNPSTGVTKSNTPWLGSWKETNRNTKFDIKSPNVLQEPVSSWLPGYYWLTVVAVVALSIYMYAFNKVGKSTGGLGDDQGGQELLGSGAKDFYRPDMTLL